MNHHDHDHDHDHDRSHDYRAHIPPTMGVGVGVGAGIERGRESNNNSNNRDIEDGQGVIGAGVMGERNNNDHGTVAVEIRNRQRIASSSSHASISDALWDQLNDEQSREVQHYESRFHPPQFDGRDNPVSIAISIATQTVEKTTEIMKATAQRVQLAYRDWQQQQKQQKQGHSNSNGYNYNRRNATSHNHNHNNMDDEFDLQFGINDLLLRGAESRSTFDEDDDDDDAHHHADIERNYPSMNGTTNNTNNTTNNYDNRHDRNREKKENNNKNQSNKSRPLQGYPFVVLQEGKDGVPDRQNYSRIAGGSERDRWGMVGNLDVFLSHLYKYYYNRGIIPMICSFVVEIICLLFTLWLSRLLLIGVNWTKLLSMKCDTDNEYNNNNSNNNTPDPTNTCYSHLSEYQRTTPLSWMSYFLIQGYTFLVLSYALLQTWMFTQVELGYAIQCRTILHDKLGVSERKLVGGALDWNDVVTKLVEGQETGSYKILHHHTATTTNRMNTTRTLNVTNNTNNNNSTATSASSKYRYNTTTSTTQPAPTTTTSSDHINNGEKVKSYSRDGNINGVANSISPSSNTTNVPTPTPSPPTPIPTLNAPPPIAFAINPNIPSLDPLQIAQRIMRKDNYMIAFWNIGLLEKATRINARYYWCSTLEFAIYQCIFNFMFNHKYEIRPSFCLDPPALERRLKTCALVIALLEPFLLVFTTIHFLLRHVYDSKTTQQYMGQATFTKVAKWKYRELNELQHQFDKRLAPSYVLAEQYCQLFGTSEYVAALGRILTFVGGAIGTVLVVLGVVVNDTLLLHVQLWGRNLVWYAGIAGIVYSIGKAITPTKQATPSVSAQTNLFQEMDTLLREICTKYTHYYPSHWKNRGWDVASVYSQFKTNHFDSEVKLFIYELLALLVTPYILYFRLSSLSSEICDFCLLTKAKLSTTISGGGDVCGFSTFDFATFSDEVWDDGRTTRTRAVDQSVMSQRGDYEHEEEEHHHERLDHAHDHPHESLSESIMRVGNVEDATRLHTKPKTRYGKMEKSFFTFKEAHPNWTHRFTTTTTALHVPSSSSSSSSLPCSISRRNNRNTSVVAQQQQQHSLSNSIRIRRQQERELHVEAATKELDTLARIEEEQKQYQQQQQQQQHYQEHNYHPHHGQLSSPFSTTRIRWNDNHYSAYSNNNNNDNHQHQHHRHVNNSSFHNEKESLLSTSITEVKSTSRKIVPPNGRAIISPSLIAHAGAGISKQLIHDQLLQHQQQQHQHQHQYQHQHQPLSSPLLRQCPQPQPPPISTSSSSSTSSNVGPHKSEPLITPVKVTTSDHRRQVAASNDQQSSSIYDNSKNPTLELLAKDIAVDLDRRQEDSDENNSIKTNATTTIGSIETRNTNIISVGDEQDDSTITRQLYPTQSAAALALLLNPDEEVTTTTTTTATAAEKGGTSSPLDQQEQVSITTTAVEAPHQRGSDEPRSRQDQYQWLDRFHEHLDKQEEEQHE